MSLSGLPITEYQNEPILSLEHHIFILNELKTSLKNHQLKVNNDGIFVIITTTDQKELKIFLKSNRPGKLAKKLEHLEIYVTDESKIIGESQAAVVFGQNIVNNQTIASKIQKSTEDKAVEEDVQYECEALAAANRLIGFGTFIDEANPAIKTFYILMRFFPGINLLDYLYQIEKPADKTKPPIYLSKIEYDDITIAQKAITALEELLLMYKDVGYMHRDIKTANFVVSSKGLKLIDLGAARKIGTKIMQPVHSYGYLPTEQCPGQPARPWDFECDLWQTVLVIAEMLTTVNYQAALQQNKELFVSFDFIKKTMHDVFVPPVKNPVTVREVLIDIIQKGTSSNLLERPMLELIPELIKDLNTSILKEQMFNVQNYRLQRTESSKVPEQAASNKPVLRRKSIAMPKQASSSPVAVPPSASMPVFALEKTEPKHKQAGEKKIVPYKEAPDEVRPARTNSTLERKSIHRRTSAMFDPARLRKAKEQLDEKQTHQENPQPASPKELSESEVLLKLAKMNRNWKAISKAIYSEADKMRYTTITTAMNVVEEKTLPKDVEARHTTLRMLQKYIEKNKPSANSVTTEMDLKITELDNLLSKLKLN